MICTFLSYSTQLGPTSAHTTQSPVRRPQSVAVHWLSSELSHTCQLISPHHLAAHRIRIQMREEIDRSIVDHIWLCPQSASLSPGIRYLGYIDGGCLMQLLVRKIVFKSQRCLDWWSASDSYLIQLYDVETFLY